jgi:soluble lytic murein transglycosylase-like protein
MVAAAALYHLPPRVLPAIQAVEGGRVGTIHMNQNGTADLGVMQVNTVWVRPLAALTGAPAAVVEAHLIYDPCFNIESAAAILRVYLGEARGDLLTAVGLYHSHAPALRDAYLTQVLRSARTLFSNRSR